MVGAGGVVRTVEEGQRDLERADHDHDDAEADQDLSGCAKALRIVVAGGGDLGGCLRGGAARGFGQRGDAAGLVVGGGRCRLRRAARGGNEVRLAGALGRRRGVLAASEVGCGDGLGAVARAGLEREIRRQVRIDRRALRRLLPDRCGQRLLVAEGDCGRGWPWAAARRSSAARPGSAVRGGSRAAARRPAVQRRSAQRLRRLGRRLHAAQVAFDHRRGGRRRGSASNAALRAYPACAVRFPTACGGRRTVRA